MKQNLIFGRPMTGSTSKQFVIQKHTTPSGVHWDLMLEHEGVLWTWRLSTDPAHIKNDPINAERIVDHPLKFLTYEGPVQNATGSVKIIDKGMLESIAFTENLFRFFCNGRVLGGLYSLQYKQRCDWILIPPLNEMLEI